MKTNFYLVDKSNSNPVPKSYARIKMLFISGLVKVVCKAGLGCFFQVIKMDGFKF
ncbi:hypothetical protein N9L43_00540 [bacterium]|nr:hypothetical protein [bacterium]